MNSSVILFAQAPKMGPKGPPLNPEEAMALLGAYIGVVAAVGVCLFVIIMVVKGLFCMTLAKALNKVSEENRDMQPGLVWLFLIPCFDVIWYFFIVIWVSSSLKKEFEKRGQDDGSGYGYGMGLTAAIHYAVYLVLAIIPYINCCGFIAGLVGIVFGIIHWVQIAGYGNKLGD